MALSSSPTIDGFAHEIVRLRASTDSNERRTAVMQLKFRVTAAIKDVLLTPSEGSDLQRAADGFLTLEQVEGGWDTHEVHRGRENGAERTPMPAGATEDAAAAPEPRFGMIGRGLRRIGIEL